MQIHWLQTIDSTNTEVMRRIAELPSGTVLAAREQTAGRGQRGNSWFTEPGANLTFSILLKFGPGELPAAQAHRLNYIMSLAVASFLEECGVSPAVKWPNDIYLGRRKICGILIENVLSGASVQASVIGVGLNINQWEFPQLSNATSLSLSTGKKYDLEPSLERLIAIFEQLLSASSSGYDAIFERYTSMLFQKGTSAQYQDYLSEEQFEGVIEGVDADGRLIVRDLTGRKRRFRFKELGYIL